VDDVFANINRIADQVVSTAGNLAGRYLDLNNIRTQVELKRYEADRLQSQPWGQPAVYYDPAAYQSSPTFDSRWLLIGGAALVAVILLQRR